MIQIYHKLEQLIESEAKRVINTIVADMKANGPEYSGKWKKSIRADRVNKWTWFIHPDVPYAYYTEYGNKGNAPDGRIYPKNASHLSLHGPDGKVFAKVESVATMRYDRKGYKFVEKTARKYNK